MPSSKLRDPTNLADEFVVKLGRLDAFESTGKPGRTAPVNSPQFLDLRD